MNLPVITSSLLSGLITERGKDANKKRVEMPMKRQETNGGSSSSRGDVEQPKMDIKILTYDMETEEGLGEQEGGFSRWKGAVLVLLKHIITSQSPYIYYFVFKQPPKQQRRFGGFDSSGANKEADRRRPEDKVLRPTEGYFRNGVLDMKHLLKPSGPRVTDNNIKHVPASKGKNKKGGKKGHGKRKGGGGKRRH
ncbi:hypothetical protein BUALT_Bualt10G0085600 [Buddleja alternifolia]|uniref:Uncharacterized protein n=1 Tax=Buddleja alternifolia TaxID=168488 RepID=A0AAV6WWA7_9LAMI|nr:hypothetical protein BUALT_Bualt10G0085600 [Buddleja alternifolia]